MTIQVGSGAIRILPEDFQFIEQGTRFALKVRDVPEAIGLQCLILCELVGSDWQSVLMADGDLDLEKDEDAQGKFAAALVKINTYLAQRFPTGTPSVVQTAPVPPGPSVEARVDAALKTSVKVMGADEKLMKCAAFICDSTGSNNQGASGTTWPRQVRDMVWDCSGNLEIRNYSVPGLGWRSAHEPTPGFLLRGKLSPLQAAIEDGCDAYFISLGVNDRNNPAAIDEALAFKAALPTDAEVHWVRQIYFEPEIPDATIVNAEEFARMMAVYSALSDGSYANGFGLRVAALFNEKIGGPNRARDKLHPDDLEKQWWADAVYMYMQWLPNTRLLEIRRNISWLVSVHHTDPVAYARVLGLQGP